MRTSGRHPSTAASRAGTRQPPAAVPIRPPSPGGPAGGAAGLQRSAGNRAVARLVAPPPPLAETGAPLPDEVRERLEPAFATGIGDARVHRGAAANAVADRLGARAVTIGSDILFARGAYAPGTQQGRLLIAHELAHVLQQRQATVSLTLAAGTSAETEADRAADAVVAGRPVGAIGPAPAAPLRAGDPADPANLTDPITVWELGDWPFWLIGPDFTELPSLEVVRQVLVDYGAIDATVLEESASIWYKPSPDTTGYWAFRHPSLGVIARAYASRSGWSAEAGDTYGVYMFLPRAGAAARWSSPGGRSADAPSLVPDEGELPQGEPEPARSAGRTGKLAAEPSVEVGPPGAPPRAPAPLTQAEQETLEKVTKLLGQFGADPQFREAIDPQELLRYYQLVFELVEDPQFVTEGGEPLVRFGGFLERNRDKIEGILRGDPPGQLTAEKLLQIIDEYGKFIAAEPVEEQPPAAEPKTLEEYDELLRYDPGWQQLSKEDRQLLIEFARLAPDEITDERVDFSRVTADMKVSMALKLSWKSWPGEIAEAAKAAFTDPTFIITLIAMIGVYVGLWLTPDPSMVTKVAAGTLTVVLLSQFAYQDIYGLAKAWMELSDECSSARTVDGLQAAGDKFAKTVGVVGFDILMFVVMWRVGKSVGPKVRRHGLARGKARAEARLAEAEAEAGAGRTPAAKPEHVGLLGEAKARAADPSNPTEVLDALTRNPKLPEQARQGLQKFRTEMVKGKDAAVRDANALKAIESAEAKGLDLPHFLAEKAVTGPQRAALRAEVLKRHAELTRLKLLEAETIKDPQVRAEARRAVIDNVRLYLHEKGILRNPKVAEVVRTHNWKDLRSAIAEATAGELLLAEYRAQNAQVFSNLEVVRRIPEKTVAAYETAQRAKGLEPDPGKLRYEGNKIVGEVVAEIDALVAEPGAGGRLKPVEIAEVKVRDTAMTGTKAAAEVAQKATRLDALRTEKPGDVLLTTRSGTKALGTDLTGQFDFSGTASVRQTTIGAAGKTGFTRQLPYSNEVLAEVARSIAEKGLPPAGPQQIPPITSQPRREEETVP